jgi:hypothetical protein
MHQQVLVSQLLGLYIEVLGHCAAVAATSTVVGSIVKLDVITTNVSR